MSHKRSNKLLSFALLGALLLTFLVTARWVQVLAEMVPA